MHWEMQSAQLAGVPPRWQKLAKPLIKSLPPRGQTSRNLMNSTILSMISGGAVCSILQAPSSAQRLVDGQDVNKKLFQRSVAMDNVFGNNPSLLR